MADVILGIGVFVAVAMFIGAGVHFGTRWLDSVCYKPNYKKIDPNQPIVLPHPQDRAR